MMMMMMIHVGGGLCWVRLWTPSWWGTKMPLFHVGFVPPCRVKSGSCSVFHVVSCRVYVCDAWDIEMHGLESNRALRFAACLAMAWTEQKSCFMSGWRFVSGLRVPNVCRSCSSSYHGMQSLQCQNLNKGDHGNRHYDHENGHRKIVFLLCFATQWFLTNRHTQSTYPNVIFLANLKVSHYFGIHQFRIASRKLRNSRFQLRFWSQKGFLWSKLPWISDPKMSHASQNIGMLNGSEQLVFQEACHNCKVWLQDFSARNDSNVHVGNSCACEGWQIGPSNRLQMVFFVFDWYGFLLFIVMDFSVEKLEQDDCKVFYFSFLYVLFLGKWVLAFFSPVKGHLWRAIGQKVCQISFSLCRFSVF